MSIKIRKTMQPSAFYDFIIFVVSHFSTRFSVIVVVQMYTDDTQSSNEFYIYFACARLYVVYCWCWKQWNNKHNSKLLIHFDMIESIESKTGKICYEHWENNKMFTISIKFTYIWNVTLFRWILCCIRNTYTSFSM